MTEGRKPTPEKVIRLIQTTFAEHTKGSVMPAIRWSPIDACLSDVYMNIHHLHAAPVEALDDLSAAIIGSGLYATRSGAILRSYLVGRADLLYEMQNLGLTYQPRKR
ncbi:MAG: hypothetical protein Q7S88_03355 [Candidatus Daviesbacteria bacterium]|nr:hypothetical protein [Candidatus Daviesbacteria bacterium]